ncbi:dipeptide epimerase [Halovenus sp. WSH3]|uniref:Dipeptide epimerase n=1 Tax=Halovenus carboxidivorans TaxID=2692199 RepID=A0A6B0T6S2_9EURY|nr:dipeptide epimerase [Halovenus carboxidivorans]
MVATDTERLTLPVDGSFTISRGSSETTTVVVVRLTDEDGRRGIGAAAPAAYYGESADSAESVLPELLDIAAEVGDPSRQQTVERAMREHAPGEAAARAAVSVAIHDLAATQAGEPLYRRLGLDPAAAPATSYTVGIDSPAGMASAAQKAAGAGYPILKVKLGTDDDRARIDAIRKTAPQARIRVDANGAWTPEEAIEKMEWLANAGVEFVEQPVAAEDHAGLARVGDAGFLPVAADESCVTAEDVPAVADAVDIVVVKLMKCGGIRPAIRQIETARAHGLEVMLGCMVESMASLAGACHLAPLVEYADLDGSLLLADDPYEGVSLPSGQIDLSAVEAGTGVERVDEE